MSDNQIEELITKINNLNLNTMADFQIKSSDYDHIPNFNGNPHNLLKFVTVCRQVHQIVCKQENSYREINELRLLSKILAKLTDEADYINTTCEFKNVEELLHYLESTFRDSRSIEQLTFELNNTKIYHKEHPLDFLHRIDKIRTLIISRHRIENTTNREIIVSNLEKNILYHFFTNMPLHIRTYLMTKTDRLKTVDDLRNLIQNENHLLFDDLISSGNMRRPGEHRPNRPPGEHDYKKKNFSEHNKKRFSNWQPPNNPYLDRQYGHNHNNQPNHQNRPAEQFNRRNYNPRYDNNNHNQHNQEWPRREQNKYFNQNQNQPRNKDQTVSMRTVSAFGSQPRQQNFQMQQEDPRDTEIRQLREQLTKVDPNNSFLDQGPPDDQNT